MGSPTSFDLSESFDAFAVQLDSGVPSASSVGMEEIAGAIARASQSEQRRLPQVPLLPLPLGPATPLIPLTMPEDMTTLVPREDTLEEAMETLWEEYMGEPPPVIQSANAQSSRLVDEPNPQARAGRFSTEPGPAGRLSTEPCPAPGPSDTRDGSYGPMRSRPLREASPASRRGRERRANSNRPSRPERKEL